MLEEALRESEFQLILNANPGSRVRVEAGVGAKRGTWDSEAPVNSLSKQIRTEWGISRPLSLSKVCPAFDFRIAIPSTKLMPKLLHKLG